MVNEEYAVRIARDWNTKDVASGYAAYVTRFQARRDHLDPYSLQQVGEREHVESWIPAEELETFHAASVGPIEVIHTVRAPAAGS